MSNTRYYARRAAGLCGGCGIEADRAYCESCRRGYRDRRRAERAADRDGYNMYMRVYKSLGRLALSVPDPQEPAQ